MICTYKKLLFSMVISFVAIFLRFGKYFDRLTRLFTNSNKKYFQVMLKSNFAILFPQQVQVKVIIFVKVDVATHVADRY